MQEANRPVTPLLENGTAAPLTPLSGGHSLLQLSDVEEALAEPTGQDTANSTAPGPSTPQEHLPVFRAASPTSATSIASEVQEVFAPSAMQPLAVVPVAPLVDMAMGQAATSPHVAGSELAPAQAPSPPADATAGTSSMAVERPVSAAAPAVTSEALGGATTAATPAVPPSPPASPVQASALPLLSSNLSMEQDNTAAGPGTNMMNVSSASTPEATPFSPHASGLSRSLPPSPRQASSSLRRTLSLDSNGFSSAVEILVNIGADFGRGGRVVDGPLGNVHITASEALPTLSTQDSQTMDEHVAITVATLTDTPQVSGPDPRRIGGIGVGIYLLYDINQMCAL